MTLIEHAKRELATLRSGKPDEMQDAIEECVLECVEAFARGEHSGSSAAYTIGILERVLRFEPLAPLTGADDGYAVRGIYGGGKPLWVRMHRDLLGLVPGDGIHVDHINGDRLDNRRANLRVCTQAQNNQNLHQRPHRGTTWNVQKSCWRAEAQLAGRQHFLGYFATQEDAAAVAAAFRRSHMPYSSDAREQKEQS